MMRSVCMMCEYCVCLIKNTLFIHISVIKFATFVFYVFTMMLYPKIVKNKYQLSSLPFSALVPVSIFMTRFFFQLDERIMYVKISILWNDWNETMLALVLYFDKEYTASNNKSLICEFLRVIYIFFCTLTLYSCDCSLFVNIQFYKNS